MTPPLLIRTLGGLSIVREGSRAEGAASQPRRLALVALVARAGDRGITREKLLSLLWPDAEPEAARRALNQALYALRRDLDADDLVLGVHELRLNAEIATCDVLAFEADLRAGRLEAATAHYAGPFLDGFRVPGASDFDRWADDERAELAHRFAGVLERLARAADARRDTAAAAGWWRRLAALDPLDARVALSLMQALVADGDPTAALQHARIYEVLIAQELDLPADESVLDLARRIRAGEVVAPARPAGLGPELVVDPVPVADPMPAPAAAALAPAGEPAPALASLAAVPVPSAAVPDRPEPAAIVDTAAAAPEDGVAVLPFVNLSGDVESTYLSDGVAEEIIHALAQVPALRVVARSSSFAFRGHAVDLADVAARLRVRTVLEGSVRRSGDRVRVTARLFDLARRTPLWAERYDGSLTDVFAIQDAIAARVVGRLSGGSGGDAAMDGRTAPSVAGRPAARSPEAYQHYLQGRQLWGERGHHARQALALFEQAIGADPEFAPAHAAVAEAYVQLAVYGYEAAYAVRARATQAAERAVALAPSLAEAHAALGAVRFMLAWDWPGAGDAFARARTLAPGEPQAQGWQALHQLCAGEAAGDAVATAAAALTLDPLGVTGRVLLAGLLVAARRPVEAEGCAREALAMGSRSPLAYHWLAQALLADGRPHEALAAAHSEVEAADRAPWALANLVRAAVRAGELALARTALTELEAAARTGYVQPSVLAMAHVAIGALDAALPLLAAALEVRDPGLVLMSAFPAFDEVREDPRWTALVHRAAADAGNALPVVAGPPRAVARWQVAGLAPARQVISR
jgi:TolB-like protein/DNA-binding SARP family transcriptional activator